jgi:DNA-binding NarL/FixJ family response regulator
MLTMIENNVSRLDRIRQPGRDQTDARPGPKILLVDDHFLIREALRGVLTELKDKTTILEAEDASEAMQIMAEHTDIGFVFLELNLPDRDGFSLLAQLRERHPSMPVVVLSARCDRDSVTRALSLGALAFIPKSEEREILRSALNLVFAGGVYVPVEILTCDEPLMSRPKLGSAARHRNGTQPEDLGLSPRQLDVLQLMMHGKTNKWICRELKLAEPTVKNHVTAILKALKVTNRTEAVITVSELGWEWPFVKAKGSIENADQSADSLCPAQQRMPDVRQASQRAGGANRHAPRLGRAA